MKKEYQRLNKNVKQRFHKYKETLVRL